MDLDQTVDSGKLALIPAIEVQGLRKVYQDVIAVDNISFVTWNAIGTSQGGEGTNDVQ